MFENKKQKISTEFYAMREGRNKIEKEQMKKREKETRKKN